MLYFDQHVHSALSNDCEIPMEEMALAAARAGLSSVTFTDHCDIENYETGEVDPDCYDAGAVREAYARALAGAETEVLLGVEIGSANHRPEKAREVASNALDLVIGSVHNLLGLPDFYTLGARGLLDDRAENEKLLERYAMEHLELVSLGGFDVLGHIGYPIRYMKKSDVSLLPYRDVFEKTFRIMAEKGIALELNTSCIRYGMEWTPAPWLLSLYKEAGGELVTLGSDAHEPQYIALGFKKGAELLRSAGFRYLTRFRQRRPELIGIE